MKKVIKNSDSIPSPLNSCDNTIKKALIEKGNHKFINRTYASDTVKQRLSTIYKNKCAFCETDTTAGAVLQVEHYRPKAKITEDSLHNGYYWLGYEWTNLLYSCSSCNRAKWNSFPIDIANGGIRIFNPTMNGLNLDKAKCKANCSDLVNEKPLLLNPEELGFRAEIHLIISPNGRIRGNSQRGKTTIEKCKLDRRNLKLARKKIVEEHLRYMMKDFERFKDNKINKKQLEYGLQKEIERIIDRINENLQYTLLAKCMLKYFDYFFVQRFQVQEQKILQEVFKRIFNN